MDKENMNEELLHDIRFFLESAECEAASASGTDAEGLPFESIDDFDILPIEYDEQQAILLKRAEDLFILCQHYSRRSKKFLEAAAYLDKSIRSLASICITRIALVKNGRILPQMNQLSTYKLFMMASFNYRKINAAIEEEMRDQLVFPMPLMGLLIRYHQTLERLRSTEVKISKINTGEISISEQCKRSLTFSEHSPNRFYTAAQNEVPAFREAYSFPIEHRELGIRNAECGIDRESDQLKMENGEMKIAVSAELTNSQGEVRISEENASNEKSVVQMGVSGHPACPERSGLTPTPNFLRGRSCALQHHTVSSRTVPDDTFEIVGPEEAAVLDEIPAPEEPCIDITLGNGQTVCVSVQYAKFMLMNPNINNHPELAEALKEFVDHHDSS